MQDSRILRTRLVNIGSLISKSRALARLDWIAKPRDESRKESPMIERKSRGEKSGGRSRYFARF